MLLPCIFCFSKGPFNLQVYLHSNEKEQECSKLIIIIVLRLSGPQLAFTVSHCLSGQGDNTSFQQTAATISSYHWAPVSQFTGDWILPSRKLVPGFEPGIYSDCTVKFIIAQCWPSRESIRGPSDP